MKTLALVTTSALAVLAAMPTSAAAVTYAFTAGNVNGTITTGAASTADAGYFLLARVDFTNARTPTGDISGTFATSFAASAAFNPQTLAFVNRFGGRRFEDSGLFSFGGPVSGTASLQSGQFITADVNRPPFTIVSSEELRVIVPAAAAVPEPATWGLMLMGFGLVGIGLRARKQARVTFA